jgi:ATP-dependent RNA helicase DeaD
VEGRADAGEPPTAEGQRPRKARIFLSLGEQDGADEAKVRETVGSLAPGLELLGVEVRRSHSFLEVRPDALDAAVGTLNGKEALGKKLLAEKARRRRR